LVASFWHWKGGPVFDKVASDRLAQMSDELAYIGEEVPDTLISKYPQFARSLSVLMRAELAERRRRGDEKP
jgi:hypothetical protein